MTFILPGGIGQLRPSGAGALAVDAFSSSVYATPVTSAATFNIPMNMTTGPNATALVVVYAIFNTYNMLLTQLVPFIGVTNMIQIGGVVQSSGFIQVAYGLIGSLVAGLSSVSLSDSLGLLGPGFQLSLACVSFKGVNPSNTVATAFGPLSQSSSTTGGTITTAVTQTNAAGLKFYNYVSPGTFISLSGGTNRQNLWSGAGSVVMAAAVSQGGAGSPDVSGMITQDPFAGIGFAVNP